MSWEDILKEDETFHKDNPKQKCDRCGKITDDWFQSKKTGKLLCRECFKEMFPHDYSKR